MRRVNRVLLAEATHNPAHRLTRSQSERLRTASGTANAKHLSKVEKVLKDKLLEQREQRVNPG